MKRNLLIKIIRKRGAIFIRHGSKHDIYENPNSTDFEKIAALDGKKTDIDTALEIALLSYSVGVINIRPDAAAAMLPADNPKLAGKILGADLYKDIQVLRFLASTGSATTDTNAVGRYEGMLKFVCDKNGVTRTEIEKFYRDGIRGLITEIVNEEFNRLSFTLDNTTSRTSYDAVLTRTSQNQYILSYERLGTKYTPITASSLEELSSKMSRSTDFNKTSIDQVKAQAKLIPALVYANARNNSPELIIDIITNFYLNPNAGTYTAFKDVYVLFERTRVATGSELMGIICGAYWNALASLNDTLANRVLNEASNTPQVTTMTREQADKLTLH